MIDVSCTFPSLAGMLVWFQDSHVILRPQHIYILLSGGKMSLYSSPIHTKLHSVSHNVPYHHGNTWWRAFLREQSVLLSITSLYQQLFLAKLISSWSPLLSAQLGLSKSSKPRTGLSHSLNKLQQYIHSWFCLVPSGLDSKHSWKCTANMTWFSLWNSVEEKHSGDNSWLAGQYL